MQSKTLMAVHLSDNEFSQDHKFIIDTMMKVPEK